MIKLLVCGITTTLGLALIAHAEGPAQGELADGTPFRTDVHGNQIVDYIAELEHSIDTLNRKVYGLEQELEQKRDALARTASKEGGPNVDNDAIAERNLVNPPPASESHQLKLPETECNGYQERIQQLEHDVADKNGDIDMFKARLEDTEVELAKAQKELTTLRVASDERAHLALRLDRTFEANRGQVKTELNQLQGMIMKRTTLYAQYRQKGIRVGFTPTPLTSQSGLTLAEISRQLKSAATEDELTEMRRAIHEIASKVDEDIALMQRLNRL